MDVRPGYKQTEVGVIPEDWEVVRLCELGKFKNGINKSSEKFDHGSPFVNLMDVFGVSSIRASGEFGLVETSDLEQRTYDIQKGDVLFIRSSVKPSGVGLSAVVEEHLPRTVYSGFLIRFRDTGELCNGFKRHCFFEEGFRRRVISASSVSANTNINQDNLKQLPLPLPPTLAEQEAIAEALSDANALIESLEQLVTKKRQIKKGAMQELLTGKKRLPGFKGEWDFRQLGHALRVRHGRSQINVACTNGKYSIFGSGGEIGRADSFLYDKPSVLIGRKGTIDCPQFASSPFWTIDTLFYTEVADEMSAKFLFYKFCTIRWRSYNEASGVPSLNARTIENIEVRLPKTDEQIAIATILSDMDAEITALEAKLSKARQLKQGMMQELLTGRIRLL